jgi:hypothetical protein
VHYRFATLLSITLRIGWPSGLLKIAPAAHLPP